MIKQIVAKFMALPHGTTTFTLSGTLVAGGAWLLANPDIVNQLAPKYGPALLMTVGGLFALARVRGIVKADSNELANPPPK